MQSKDAVKPIFVRDETAWLSYLMIGTYCYAAAGLGPLVTFLRAEMDLNYTLAACHFSLWSGGVVTAGATGDRFMKRFGRRNTVWGATLSLCIGIVLLIVGRDPVVTIPGAYLCGVSGSTMCQTVTTILADRFTSLRAVALGETSIAGSLFCAIAPLSISFFSKTQFGWRAALLVPIFCFLTYYLSCKKVLANLQLSNADNTDSVGIDAAPLPRAYWVCWILVYFSVAGEWSIMYWTADYLENVIKLVKADAAACVTSFLLAMLLGRIIGSRLVRELAPINLLRIASLVAILGFSIFWSSKVVMLCLIGLFITGLGVSNFYPLTLSQAIASAPGRTPVAMSRMSLASGGATLSCPLLLGLIAEKCGILSAFGVIATLLVFCSLIVFLPIWAKK